MHCTEDIPPGNFLDSKNQYDASDRAPFNWEHLVALIALRIRESLSLPSILQITADETHQLLKCDRVVLYQFAPDWSGQVVVEAVSAPEFSLIKQIERDFCFEDSWLKPYQEGHISSRTDITAATDLTPCHAEFLASFQVRANLVVPILSQSQLWGFLIAHNCATPRQWLPEEINGLQQIATHVGIALYQADLLEQLQEAKAALETQVVALHYQETRWQFALEATGDGVWDWNLQTNKVFFSPQMKLMLGYGEDEIGDSLEEWSSRIHPDDQTQCYNDLHQHLRGETALCYGEYRLRCKDGSYKWTIDRGKVIEWAENGQPLRMLGIQTDISDRKLAEEALRQSEARLQHLAAHVPSIIYTIIHPRNAPTYFEYISPAVTNIFEIIPEQAYADISLMFGQWHIEDVAAYEAISRHSIATLEPFSFEWRIITPSGTMKWLNVYASAERRQNGDVARYGVVKDISDRKSMELAIQESDARQQAIVAAIPDLLLRVRADDDLCLDFISPSSSPINPFIPIQQHLSEVLPPDLLERQLQAIKQAIATKELQVYSHQLLKFGQLAYEEVRVAAINNQEALVIRHLAQIPQSIVIPLRTC